MNHAWYRCFFPLIKNDGEYDDIFDSASGQYQALFFDDKHTALEKMSRLLDMDFSVDKTLFFCLH